MNIGKRILQTNGNKHKTNMCRIMLGHICNLYSLQDRNLIWIRVINYPILLSGKPNNI